MMLALPYLLASVLLLGSSLAHAVPTVTVTGRPSRVLVRQAIPPSPTNSGTCVLHIDHYHCSDEEASSPSTPKTTSDPSTHEDDQDHGEDNGGHGDHDEDAHDENQEEVISNTSGEGCVQHGTHFHCPVGVQSSCNPVEQNYDLGLHIGALFVLLVASLVGVVLPVVLGTRTNRVVSNIFFALKHFGTGIIISTAFIHLLMHAFVMFANECLGSVEYEAIAPAIAMVAVMLVFAIDFFAARMMTAKPHSGSLTDSEAEKQHHNNDLMALGHDHSCNGTVVAYDGSSKQAHWEVQLLEAGIIFHSIMIGVTLGAQGGNGFIPTFCAIVFHQFFEGLGLGARIAGLLWPLGGAYKKWLMCAAYTLVTPLGIAIGIAAQSSFNLNSKSTILTIGVLDSISAGILLYTGIVRLLVMEWINGELLTASRLRVAVASISMILGLFSMSFIGKWA